MSLIDWSDPEEMLGLLVDYVADEASASSADRERRSFLRALSGELSELADQSVDSVAQLAQALRELRGAQPEEFLSDPVIAHLDACIEEVARIERESAAGG